MASDSIVKKRRGKNGYNVSQLFRDGKWREFDSDGFNFLLFASLLYSSSIKNQELIALRSVLFCMKTPLTLVCSQRAAVPVVGGS